jgi:hypothetical protein
MNQLDIYYKKINIIVEYKFDSSVKFINNYIKENIDLFDYIDIINNKYCYKYNTYQKENFYLENKSEKISNKLVSILAKINFNSSYYDNKKEKLLILNIYGRRNKYYISNIVTALQMYSNTPKTVIIITNNIYNINNRFLYDKNIILDYIYFLKNNESYKLNKFTNSKFIFLIGINNFILKNLLFEL